MGAILTFILHFLIGGGVVAGVVYLATEMETKYAAILYAIPIQFLIASFFIYQKSGSERVALVTKDTVFSLLVTLLFVILYFTTLKMISFWPATTLSLLFFCSGLFVLVRYL